MDDLDDFYSSLGGAPGPDEAATASPEKSNIEKKDGIDVASDSAPASKSLEDDFFDLLNVDAPGSASENNAPAGADANGTGGGGDDDFLSWLDDPTGPTTDPTAITGAGASPSSAAPNTASEGGGASGASTDIIDDIFGTASHHSSSADMMSALGTSPTPTPTASSYGGGSGGGGGASGNTTRTAEAEETEKYISELDAIIHSGFPDTAQLRQLIFEAGYIPESHRHSVWTLLLTGNCVLDEEAKNYTAGAGAISDQQLVKADCTALLSLSDIALSAQEAEQITASMCNIIILYCVRRSVRYNSVMSKVLAPLMIRSSKDNSLTTASASSGVAAIAGGGGEANSVAVVNKPLISASFYALAQNFLPVVNVQNETAADLAMDTLHFWLRLLLTYHSPILVQHLDRVIPGWERPAASASLSKVAHEAASSKVNADLDDLEREMGLTEEDSTSAAASSFPFSPSDVAAAAGDGSSTWRSASSNINSGSPHRGTAAAMDSTAGCIHSQWITGIFAGSLPLSQSALLMDWSIVNNERYAGIYFIASLLEICSPSLLTLNGASIRHWFEDIAAGCAADWYKLCNASDGNYYAVLACSADVEMSGFDTSLQAMRPVDNWGDFIRGWMQATYVLMNTTPVSFRKAVISMEEWSVDAAERSKQELAEVMAKAAAEQQKVVAKQQQQQQNLENDIPDDIFSSGAGDDDDIFGTSGDSGNRESDYFSSTSAAGAAAAAATLTMTDEDVFGFGGDDEEEKYASADLLFDMSPQRAVSNLPARNTSSGSGSGSSASRTTTGDNDDSESLMFGATKKGNFMSQLRRLSTQFQGHDSAAAAAALTQQEAERVAEERKKKKNRKKWIQDSKDSNTMCLWSEPSEVVPCLCSGSRRPAITPMNVIEVFKKFSINSSSLDNNNNNKNSKTSASAGDIQSDSFQDLLGLDDTSSASSALEQLQQQQKQLMNRPLKRDAVLSQDKPFFFGIDCRSTEEKALGTFPKTYAMDPATLTDSDELSRILDVLRPIASNVHLCLIGAGEEYIRWSVRNAEKAKRGNRGLLFGIAGGNTDAGSDGGDDDDAGDNNSQVSRAVIEQHARLNAVAMFFLKQSFKHLSVLEGGFAAAVHYLQRNDTPLSVQSLVDVHDKSLLESLLGLEAAPSSAVAAGVGDNNGLVGRIGSAIRGASGGITAGSSGANSANNSAHNNSNSNSGSGGLVGLLRGGSSNGRNSSASNSSHGTASTSVSVNGTGKVSPRARSGSGSNSNSNSNHGLANTSSSNSSNTSNNGGNNTSQNKNSGGPASSSSSSGASGATTAASVKETAGVYGAYVSSAVGGYLSSWTTPASTAAAPSTSTAPDTASGAATNASTTARATAAAANTKQLLSGLGSKLSMFGSSSLEAAKKAAAVVAEKAAAQQAAYAASNAAAAAAAAAGSRESTQSGAAARDGATNEPKKSSSSSSFTIDDDDEEGKNKSSSSAAEMRDTNAVSVRRTEAEKKRVLALHKLAGLQKGNTVNITKEDLPGAVLFPAIKDKKIKVSAGQKKEGEDSESADTDPAAAATATTSTTTTKVHRFLVVTKERFMVLDSNGGGVGSLATVKSNHHLSELTQLKFKKQDPEFVTLYFESFTGEKTKQYRVGKRKELVEVLQKNMKQFK